MKRLVGIILVACLVIVPLAFLPGLSILVNAFNERPTREIKMEIVGMGVSKYGLIMKAYSPLCYNDAGHSDLFAECATAIYSFRALLHTSIEYDKNGKVLQILRDDKTMSEDEVIKMTLEYRQLFLKKYPGYNLPSLPQ